jgi:hypothetical protein
VKFANKLAVTCVLLVLFVVATVSATDYSQIEKYSESTLSDPTIGIIAPIVHVNASLVTINYITNAATVEAVVRDIGFMVYMYKFIVNKYPEVGDLLITSEDIDQNL